MPADMVELTGDLADESEALRGLVADLDESGWSQPTPAIGWSLADQVTHLAHFDDVAVTAATDPERFIAERDRMLETGGIDPNTIAASYRAMSGAQVLAWFDQARGRLIATFRPLDPGLRLPWYGPPMSAASSVTARLMETWAHGQDVADTFGVERAQTGRLRHVAHLGVRARSYSYAVNGLQAPTTPVRVELDAPGGGHWAWGPEDAADRVCGAALDFCLVVTQRRHRADTALTIDGPAAREWMAIAQAFAGPAGTGREPS